MLVQLFLQPALGFDQLVVVGIRLAELFADLLVLAHHIDDRLDGFLNDLVHGLAGIERGLLLQQAARVALREHRLADVLVVHAGHDAQQGALAGAIQAQHADLRAVVEAERNIAQHLFFGRMDTAHAHHGVDDLLGG